MAGYIRREDIQMKKHIHGGYMNEHIHERDIHTEKTYIWRRHKYAMDIHTKETY